mgnify:FL=1
MNIRYSLYALIGGFLLDLVLGDPHTPYHPACIIGKYISGYEKLLRKHLLKDNAGEKLQKRAGIYLVVLVLITATLIPALLLMAAYWMHPYVGLGAEMIMCYAVLAARSLQTESMKVYDALQTDGLEAGRKAVSMIVGRDTQNLDEKGVTKAAVETIAENFSDGVVAPMFYMILGGTVAGYFYKAVNTMDSMVGYKNEKYLYFGRAAAHLDDIVNYIPARISALVMIGTSFLMKLDGPNAWKIFIRDRHNHASPNSAQTEAVAAGALDVMLAGDAYYFGQLYHKKTIGDDIRPIEVNDIRVMNRLMYASAWITLVLMSVVKWIVLTVV